MKILFTGENVLDPQIHGIGRMSRCVLRGLMDIGHTCIARGVYEDLFDDRLQTSTDINDGDVLLLPANGLVGVNSQTRELIRSSKLPIVSLIYDMIPYIFHQDKNPNYIHWIEETIEVSDHIITISHHSESDIIEHLQCNKPITVIHPGVPFEPPEYEPIEPEDYFLSVGGYGEHKGYHELLRAILQNQQQLIMVGIPFGYDWPKTFQEETKALVSQACNQGLLVEFHGISDEMLIDLYQHAQALVYPTRYEGFGLPIIEAMSCGCPVITTGLTATCEAAGGAALFIKPTTEDIVTAMHYVVSQRTELIQLGLQRTRDCANWRKIAALYANVLDKI